MEDAHQSLKVLFPKPFENHKVVCFISIEYLTSPSQIISENWGAVGKGRER